MRQTTIVFQLFMIEEEERFVSGYFRIGFTIKGKSFRGEH